MKGYSIRSVRSIICLLAVPLLVSCASVNTMRYDADSSRRLDTNIGDTFLNESIQIKDLQVSSNSAGNKIVNILFKNTIFSRVVVQVRVVFFDANGVEIDDPWGYKPLTVESKQEKWIKFVSINPKAQTYALSFKKP